MPIKSKILTLLSSRKTPMLAKDIANYFAVNKQSISGPLSELRKENKIDYRRIGNNYFWFVNDRQNLAINKSAKPAGSTYKTSYPHVRGYDD